MRPLLVTAGTMCVTIVLLALGQFVIFTEWSALVWDPSAPVQSLSFDEWVLYALFPFAVIVGALLATAMARNKPFVVSMLGTSPAFVGAGLLRRFEFVSMILILLGYAVLCFATVKLMARRRGRRGMVR